MEIATDTSRRIHGRASGAANPFWSPDSRFVGFFADGKLKKIDVLGGPPQTLCDFRAVRGVGGTWSPEGVIVFASGGELKRVSAAFAPEFEGYPVWSPDGGRIARWRRDGKELYYVAPDRKLMAVPVKTGAAFETGTPATLFETQISFSTASVGHDYAVSKDGKRFLIIGALEQAAEPMTVTVNWMAGLK